MTKGVHDDYSEISSSSGGRPVLVKVVENHQNQATMGTIQQQHNKRQGISGRMCILIGLAGIVVYGLFSDNIERWDTDSPFEKEQPSTRKNNVDVNAPPVKQTKAYSGQSFWEEALEQSKPKSTAKKGNSFSIFSWNSEPQPEPSRSTKKAKKGVPKSKPIPIIDENDDRVPQAAAGAIIRAADALLCRESVIDYVINATDLKDECDGLKKAYTKNCGGDEEEATLQQRHRNLKEATSAKTNPVIEWRKWLHRKVQAFRRYWNPKPFLIEDEILDEWDNAQYEVDQGWDGNNVQQTYQDALHHSNTATGRHLTEAERFAKADSRIEKQGQRLSDEGHIRDGTAPPILVANKTNTGIKEKQKLHNLALPTTKQHVSEKMLTETLYLQQEEKMVANVKAATSNATANAVSDAAKSTKAVSDTYDYVSSVLNDPGSVEARTCCTSILNVFHEECSVDAEEDISDARLFIVVAVIALCGMVKSLIRHFQIRWLPEAAGCILVGVASGWVLSYFPHHDISFDGKWFLRILVPPIVFEAALSIDKRSFNRHVVPIMFYAVIGTLMSTGLTAWIVHKGSLYYHGFCETIPVVESLAFGSLISSIDPIAVLSVLSNMGLTDTDTIYVLIFGESLLNDGVAIVLYQTLVHFLDANMEVDGDAVTAAAIHFIVVAVGSLLVGLGAGICCTVYYWAFHGCQTPLVEILMFCCWALLPYYICDGIEWSGIVAVVAAGFVMDVQVIGQKVPTDDAMETYLEQKEKSPNGTRRERRQQHRPIFCNEGHLSREAKIHIGFVTEIIATMMETAIFAYLGLFLFSSRYHWNNYHTMIAIGACCVSRAIMIPSLSALANWVIKIQRVRNDCNHQHLPQLEKDSSLGKANNAAGVIIDKKMQLVLWFAGLRGAMSFALVEDIPTFDAVTGEGTRLKSELKAMTSACIIFTVFVLGGLTYYMMDGLGMAPLTAKERQSNMEMTALLSGSFSNKPDDDEDENDGAEYNRDPLIEMPAKAQAPSSGNNRFRQRNSGSSTQ